ncbi:MAG: CRISPR-associated CARF protein Csa3 [Candidatus Aenigmatarchaeota archaeon]
MSGKTLISVIHKKDYLARAVAKLGDIDKLVLIATPEGQSDVVDDSIEDVRKFLDEAIEVEIIREEAYDLVGVAKIISEVIQREAPKEVIINVTHGRKIQAFAAALAGFANRENVTEVVYLPEEGGKITLPRLEIALSDKQYKVLEGIHDGKTIPEISEELDVSDGMVYNYLRDLKEQEYVQEGEEGKELTESGRLMLVLKGENDHED